MRVVGRKPITFSLPPPSPWMGGRRGGEEQDEARLNYFPQQRFWAFDDTLVNAILGWRKEGSERVAAYFPHL